jgi:hypothetical protein
MPLPRPGGEPGVRPLPVEPSIGGSDGGFIIVDELPVKE